MGHRCRCFGPPACPRFASTTSTKYPTEVIAPRGCDSSAAYELDVTGEVAHGRTGPDADPVCNHRTAYYLAVGVLDPEPEPPAPALTLCGYCRGRGWETVVGKSGAAFRFACQVCEGAGTVAVGDDVEPSSHAVPLPVAPAASAPAVCGRCGGAGTLIRQVATALDVYPVTTTCRACGGTSLVEPPALGIAA